MDDDDTPVLVVRNDEEQYSWWPQDRPIPPGWYPAGYSGTKAECLAHIDRIWTDIRPLSMRRSAEETDQ